MDRKGRQWTWAAWESAVADAWRGNYATASLLVGSLSLALLSCAIVMRAVAPTPAELDESPMAYAKREAARAVFESVYMSDCDLAALGAMDEPFRMFAKKTGLYAPEAFAPALACLDEHLKAQGIASLDLQLRADKSTELLLDLNCVGDLRHGELCARAFSYAKNRGRLVGRRLADRVGAAESQEPR